MRKFIAALALVVLIAELGGTSWPNRAANGDLDRSFGGYGTNGRVIGDPFPGTQIADAVALPDDKLLVVGSNSQDFVVARYDASGKLDPSFGNTGVTTLDFDNHADVATAVALNYNATQILVAGTTSFGSRALPNSDFALARLNADGTPDTSFSQDGKVTVDFNGRADQATFVRPSGSQILVAGTVEQNPPGIPCAPDCNQDFGFAQLTADGLLNPNFGNGGKVQNDFGGNDTLQVVDFTYISGGFFAVGSRSIGTTSEYVFASYTGDTLGVYRTGTALSRLTDVVAEPDEVVATGEASGDFGLLRLKYDGSPVGDFGTNGVATVDFGGDDSSHTLYRLADGTFFVAGSSDARLAMVHVTAKGQVVPNSAVTTDLADTGAESVRALALTLSPDVRLWTIGSLRAGNLTRLAMTRHFLDGTADDGGRQTTDFSAPATQQGLPNNNDRAKAAVFQSDGKLLVAGSTQPYNGQGGAALVRYTAAGALDPSFDSDGQLILTTFRDDGAIDIAVQPDGKIVVAGGDFRVARLNPDGSPDSSFNGTGYAQISIDPGGSLGMALQSDGKIVLAGLSDPPSFTLARFTAAGMPDTSFGLDGIVRTAVGFQAVALDVALQADGKLVAAGATLVSQIDANLALVRYNADGSLDHPSTATAS